MFAYAKRERRSEVSGRSTLKYEAPSVTPYIRRCNTRNLAGNPDSPQAVIFLTSFIDILLSF